jgi:2-polyprenyl-3-methyl-5-hydroxy-6-metoxy-1,4-benzoquinol methylase
MAFESSKQGAHVDPSSPNAPKLDKSSWSPRQLRAFSSRAMQAYRDSLKLPGQADIRASLVSDLSEYHKLSEAECIDRCVNWEQWSVKEWQEKPRDTQEGLRDFYKQVESWSFDLLWFAYLQAEGYEYPISALVGDSLPDASSKAPYHLDFGSGVGVTCQMFMRLGYRSDLADISDTLLAFARFRLDRRGDNAGFINLNGRGLEPNKYDVITAFDTLTHVPEVDFSSVVAMLHASLRPNGVLITNFDVRPPSAENAWHLYSDDLVLRFRLQRAGFEPIEGLDRGFMIYRRVERDGYEDVARGIRDLVLLKSPLRPVVRRLRAMLRR